MDQSIEKHMENPNTVNKRHIFIIAILMLFMITGCNNNPKVNYDQSRFGNLFLKYVSVIDLVKAGNPVQISGVYGYRYSNRTWHPMLTNWMAPGTMGYALLADSLLYDKSVYIKLKGSIITDTLRFKPDIALALPFKSVKVDSILDYKDLSAFTELVKTQAKDYIKQIENHYRQKGTDLNLPSDFNWQIAYDEKKEEVVVYARIERISQLIHIEFVYDYNKVRLLSVYAMEQFKGEK